MFNYLNSCNRCTFVIQIMLICIKINKFQILYYYYYKLAIALFYLKIDKIFLSLEILMLYLLCVEYDIFFTGKLWRILYVRNMSSWFNVTSINFQNTNLKLFHILVCMWSLSSWSNLSVLFQNQSILNYFIKINEFSMCKITVAVRICI